MNLKPWHKLVDPREDLRDGRPLDAAEFAVHLDQVRNKTAAQVYQEPRQFFERTYMTPHLAGFGGEVMRRLSGETTQTNAVFHMITQFGGGKTHALTMLYHLANNGPKAADWSGVPKVLKSAGIPSLPQARVAVFVGTEFDSLTGRGGEDGTPKRKSPWGEIAFQLGGEESFALVAEHDQKASSPGGDVLHKILPQDQPCLILMDELLNYLSRSRNTDYAGQLYNFIQSLSETCRSRENIVLAVSIPSHLSEMTQEDEADFDRFSKLLDRLGKAVTITGEGDTAEIIRRRLFEWQGLPPEAEDTVRAYTRWVVDHRSQIPGWFPTDQAEDVFKATYPFHPMVISMFERKWQSLPRFQRTRGILRLLALWVSKAYRAAYEGGRSEPLIGFGSAPLEDQLFRAAVFEQMGNEKLGIPVVSDICGRSDSHAVRLDEEAVETIRKSRLHRQTAEAIFFESNGGQTRDRATTPEIRLALADPALEIGNVVTVLENLAANCYYLTAEQNGYKFGLAANLNKILSDRLGNIQAKDITDRIRKEVQTVFTAENNLSKVFFPEQSSQVPDRAVLTMVIMDPDRSAIYPETLDWVETMTREHGSSGRTYKSALIWCGTDGARTLMEEMRKLLAWEAIRDEASNLKLDESQKRQLDHNIRRAGREATEAVWRSYHFVLLLGQDNTLKTIDLGLISSSMASSMTKVVINRLRQDGELEFDISPSFLVRNWVGQKEWSTKAVRDAFYASPRFPRLMDSEALKETISRGVGNAQMAYVTKDDEGKYPDFHYNGHLDSQDVELVDDVFIITKETAEVYLEAGGGTPPTDPPPSPSTGGGGGTDPEPDPPLPPTLPETVSRIKWSGEVPSQKWMNLYTKALSRWISDPSASMKINLNIIVEGQVSVHKVQEMKSALKELGLEGEIDTEG